MVLGNACTHEGKCYGYVAAAAVTVSKEWRGLVVLGDKCCKLSSAILGCFSGSKCDDMSCAVWAAYLAASVVSWAVCYPSVISGTPHEVWLSFGNKCGVILSCVR